MRDLIPGNVRLGKSRLVECLTAESGLVVNYTATA